jgi:hypothetical protein
MKNKNKAHYKWSKLFASKRFNSNNGVITLTAFEQQELLDDIAGYKDFKQEICLAPQNKCKQQCNECKGWLDEI